MNDVENYSAIIDSIFGPGTTTFNVRSTHSNSVIGALNTNSYEVFKNNFVSRLEIIRDCYSAYPQYLREIKIQINEIQSEKNWEGAYAEVVAFYHLNSNLDYTLGPIRPNITQPKTRGLAESMGKQETNHDGYVAGCDFYFDVKCLKDNVNEILEGIFTNLYKHIGKSLNIVASYPLDITYEDFQKNRKSLLKELKDNVSLSNQIKYLNSRILPELSYNITWESGIASGIRSYDPYKHAESFHKTIFNYANKFLKNKPTIIVLVKFPWYNNIDGFADTNMAFYRSFSRRFFCQYRHDVRKFKTLFPHYTGRQSINSVTKHLSGIIILEDKSILSNHIDSTNVNSYVFLNPNARKRIASSMSTTYLRTICTEIYDDFESDNY